MFHSAGMSAFFHIAPHKFDAILFLLLTDIFLLSLLRTFVSTHTTLVYTISFCTSLDITLYHNVYIYIYIKSTYNAINSCLLVAMSPKTCRISSNKEIYCKSGRTGSLHERSSFLTGPTTHNPPSPRPNLKAANCNLLAVRWATLLVICSFTPV